MNAESNQKENQTVTTRSGYVLKLNNDGKAIIPKIGDIVHVEASIVIDPFGGVALGALDAMRLGLRWRGCELEPRFADLGNQNIGLWNSRYSRMPHWCTDATLFQGDSRHLLEVLETAEGSVSSPPYADGSAHTGGDDPHPERMEGGVFHGVGLDGAVSSPPYAETINSYNNGIDWKKTKKGYPGRINHQERIGLHDKRANEMHYGATPGQLGAMKAGNFDGAVASPPFRQTSGGTGETAVGRGDPNLLKRHSAGNAAAKGYGETDGQLANMGDGDFDAAVSSPPYDELGSGKGRHVDANYSGYGERTSGHGHETNPAQIGGSEDFWPAARTIVEQVYLALRPGAHACWVVKGFVKNKQLVDFPGQWRQLCEAVGFESVHEHHAMLMHHRGTSNTLEGGTVEHITESKSFFRRLAEKKGSPRIDYETVLCMVKNGD